MNKIIEDYEKRNVDFSLIHNESVEVYNQLIDLMNLQEGQRLLDFGGGYGSFLYKLINHIPSLGFEYHLLDSSALFIDKAKSDFEHYTGKNNSNIKVSFINIDVMTITDYQSQYDVILCKMFIHEIPKSDKELIFSTIFSLLKPGGKVYFWKPNLTEDNYDFYTRVISKKDQLANFDNLAIDRTFILNSDLESYLKQSGFRAVDRLFDFDYILHTERRLESEFQNKVQKLEEWNEYIKEQHELLNQKGVTSLEEGDKGELKIGFKRIIYSALK